MSAMQRIRLEFLRVFGAAEVTSDQTGVITVRADGWPDSRDYVAARAMLVLANFASNHGMTEQGDADVCRALEAAGALIER